MNRWKLLLSLVLILLATAGALSGAGYFKGAQPQPTRPPTVRVTRGEVNLTITSPGELIGTSQTNVSFVVSGPLEAILVEASQVVEQGQVLARLGNRPHYEAAVQAARLDVLRAEQTLTHLLDSTTLVSAEAHQAVVSARQEFEKAKHKRTALNYPRASDLAKKEAEARYNQALSELAFAQKAYDEVAWMGPEVQVVGEALARLVTAQKERDTTLGNYNWLTGKPTQADIEAADARLTLTLAQLEEAERALANGPDIAQVTLAQAELDHARTALAGAEADLAATELRAPFDGVVLSVQTGPGDWMLPGQPLLRLADLTKVEVRATVVEEGYPRVKPGLPVEIYFDAFPDTPLSGRVTRVVPDRQPGERPLYPLYISLDNIPTGLAPGMNADVSIIVDARSNVLRLPRSLLRLDPNGKAQLQVWTAAGLEERSVQAGLRGDLYVEILTGLDEGEEVVGQ